jgi:transcriptional regulator with XRE-family HTH domain
MSDEFPFNHVLVRDRRMLLGMSQRLVARAAGVSQSTLVLIERGNGNYRQLTVGQVQNLAEALTVTVADLFTKPADADPEGPASGDTVADGALLGEVLHTARRRHVNTGEVLLALGWGRDRYAAALDALRQALSGTGLHLKQYPGYVVVMPDGQSPETIERYKQIQAARIGIGRREAKVIRQTALGQISKANMVGFLTNSQTPTRAQKVAALMRSGLIKHWNDGTDSLNGSGGQLVLSDDLRYCLALDE